MKANLEQLFLTNSDHEKNGIWLMVSEDTGFNFKRWGGENSPAVKKALFKYYKPVEKQVEMGTISVDKEKLLVVSAFVDSCMLDWNGVDFEGVENIPYSKEVAVKVFLKLPDLFELVFAHAKQATSFKDEVGND